MHAGRMRDHLAKGLAVRPGQLIQSAHPRPMDVAPQAHRGFLRPLPVVFAQGLFGHFLEAVGVAVREFGLGLQCLVHGPDGPQHLQVYGRALPQPVPRESAHAPGEVESLQRPFVIVPGLKLNNHLVL